MKVFLRLFLIVALFALLIAPMLMTRSAVAAPANGSGSAAPTATSDDDDQPHMQAALDALRQAEQQLAEAKHDKGGHRAKALAATREAIKHVEEGMRFADKDDHKKHK